MENWHIPYQTELLPPAQRVLVLAPHPDDEIFGCGGAIALYRQRAAQVNVAVLTDGAGYARTEQREGTFALRQAETKAALAGMGIGTPPQFVGLPDRTLSGHAGLPDLIAKLLTDTAAQVVLAPALTEIHPDHLATGRATLAAIEHLHKQAQPLPTLLQYEVGFAQKPNLLVDITDVWFDKCKAMQCFPSQATGQDYPRHIEALNVFRTYTLPASVRYAEAFNMLAPAQLAAELQAGQDLVGSATNRWITHVLAAAEASVETLQNQLVEQTRLLANLQAQSATERQELVLRQVQAFEKIGQLTAALARTNELNQEMLGSSSWRITRPLRSLMYLLRGRS